MSVFNYENPRLIIDLKSDAVRSAGFVVLCRKSFQTRRHSIKVMAKPELLLEPSVWEPLLICNETGGEVQDTLDLIQEYLCGEWLNFKFVESEILFTDTVVMENFRSFTED